jgi:hypothetical protein
MKLLAFVNLFSKVKHQSVFFGLALHFPHFSTFLFFLTPFFLRRVRGASLHFSHTSGSEAAYIFLVRDFRIILVCFIRFEVNLFGNGSRLMIDQRYKSHIPIIEGYDI